VSWGVLNAAMLAGLAGAIVPIVIHLLNRTRDPVIEWGAMQFLELGRQARRRMRLNELLLMLARMALLALVAFALARPYWSRRARAGEVAGQLGLNSPPRDVVLVIDGSDSMERASGATTLRALAVAWSRQYVSDCRPGDSIAVLIAADRVRGLVAPPSFDPSRVNAALASIRFAHGSSDLPAALIEAFRILERTSNPVRDVVVLTDNQRHAWRPGERARWALVRELALRLPVVPRIWSIALGAAAVSATPNGGLAPLALSRALVPTRLPIEVTTTLANSGPGQMVRTAELLVDGQVVPGTAQTVGPIPAGGRAPLTFRTALTEAGSHVLTVRLAGARDAMPGDDESSLPIEVAQALPVLLVNGEPGVQPLTGETDFLRAALAPTGDDTPQVSARVVTANGLSADSLKDQRAVVLANVDRLASAQELALRTFVETGGGLLVAPGDRTDPAAYRGIAWMPAGIGELKGSARDRKTIAHPDPRTFTSALLGPFARGERPALGEADFFAYRLLSPVAGASVSARLDTGDPWVVERPSGRGRVVVLATAIDAEAGTLPVNADFVPLAYEWALWLAGGGAPAVVQPGEPLIFELSAPVPPAVATLAVEAPRGDTLRAPITRAGGRVLARLDDTSESGIYRLALPSPPGGNLYAAVARDDRESDLTPLERAEAAHLAEGWPLVFENDPGRLLSRISAADAGARHEIWRPLVLAALAGLCLEIYLTRRLVRGQGLAGH
jgi:Aerotolerance regulator N-terminal/von Willebrand factor type A domain